MKSIQDSGLDLKGKRVLVRADFNVSLNEQNEVTDDFRIRATLPTVKYLIGKGAKIILMSHLGEPKGQVAEKYRLTPVAKKLSEYLDFPVFKSDDCVGQEIEQKVSAMSDGQILLLENLRFHAEEEKNDENFAKSLASLGDYYVNDGFSVSHRPHASVVAIAKFLPSFAGLLVQKEVENLSRARDNPNHPLAVVIGGAKMSTKIKLIESFFDKAENIILGGALANTVLHAKGIAVGRSIIEESMVPEIKKFEITSTKIHLPIDAIICASSEDPSIRHPGPIGKTEENEFIFDIGADTEVLFARIIKSSKMVVWNGPMGWFEIEAFAHGTLAVAQAITSSNAYSIVGGGETVAFLEKAGLADKFSFVSTGGGAMLEFLSGEEMPGLKALEQK